MTPEAMKLARAIFKAARQKPFHEGEIDDLANLFEAMAMAILKDTGVLVVCHRCNRLYAPFEPRLLCGVCRKKLPTADDVTTTSGLCSKTYAFDSAKGKKVISLQQIIDTAQLRMEGIEPSKEATPELMAWADLAEAAGRLLEIIASAKGKQNGQE